MGSVSVLFENATPAWVIREEASVASTMDLAKDLLEDVDEQRPGIAYADRQTQGKGQQGRVWEQAPTGITMTLVFSTGKEARTLLGYSLVVACAVREVARRYGAALFFKWPNDLLHASGDKIGGVLVEVLSRDDRQYVLTGIGINVLNTPSLSATASLHDAGFNEEISREQLTVAIAQQLYTYWQEFLSSGFASFKNAWNEAAFGRGELMGILREGSQLEGIFEGVDDEGFLLIHGAKGRERLVSGTIRYIGDKSYVTRI